MKNWCAYIHRKNRMWKHYVGKKFDSEFNEEFLHIKEGISYRVIHVEEISLEKFKEATKFIIHHNKRFDRTGIYK